MGKQKWFRNRNLIALVLAALGAALVAAAKEITSRIGNNKKGGSQPKT